MICVPIRCFTSIQRFIQTLALPSNCAFCKLLVHPGGLSAYMNALVISPLTEMKSTKFLCGYELPMHVSGLIMHVSLMAGDVHGFIAEYGSRDFTALRQTLPPLASGLRRKLKQTKLISSIPRTLPCYPNCVTDTPISFSKVTLFTRPLSMEHNSRICSPSKGRYPLEPKH